MANGSAMTGEPAQETERDGLTEGSGMLGTASIREASYLAPSTSPGLWGKFDRFMTALSLRIQLWLFGWPTRLVSRSLDVFDGIGHKLEGTLLRKVLQWTIYPLFMALSVVIGFWLVENGINERAFFGNIFMFAVFGLIFMPLERIMPWCRAWLRNRDDASADAMIFFVGKPLTALIGDTAKLWTVAWAVDRIGPEVGLAIWPIALHPVLQVLLLLTVRDFFRYWYHRWMHEVPFMWRWHSVHHSSRRLYWFNGSRSHPLESWVSTLALAIPLVLIQAPGEIVFVTGILGRTIGRFQHTNLDLRLGVFDYIFSSPKNHRWHHAPTTEGDCNYGGDIILFDHLFGTFYLPKDKLPPTRIGVGSVPDYPRDWWGMMKAPFIYHRLPKAKGYDRELGIGEAHSPVPQASGEPAE